MNANPASAAVYAWTDRYPWIVEAARKIRQWQFMLDAEAVVLGVIQRGSLRDGDGDQRAGMFSAEGLECSWHLRRALREVIIV
jgi:hypothetical protein